MSERVETCVSCRFWERRIDGYKIGQCRKKAPNPSSQDNECAWWPTTGEVDWCGEFKPKQKPGK